MLDRRLNFISSQFGKLDGYKLMFNKKPKQGVAANIEQSPSDSIGGILYDFPDNEINFLDSKEGYANHYDRIQVINVITLGTSIEATTFIAKQDKIVNGLSPKENI